MHIGADVLRGQGKVLDALELEFHVVVSCLLWMLRTELGSSERTTHVLCCPSPLVTFYGGEQALEERSCSIIFHQDTKPCLQGELRVVPQ